MRKNKFLYDLTIEKIWYGGIWIATHEDWRKIIIKWGLFPWFVVDCKIIKKKKDYIQAKLLEIKSYGDNSLIDTCKHYKEWCGGCKWSILDYDTQLSYKKDLILDSFRFFSKFIDKFSDFEMIPAPSQWYYRNKIEFSFGKIFPEENWNLGFHKQWFFSKVVDVQRCYLISEKMHTVFDYLKNFLINSWLPVYDQKIHKWFFRHLVIRQWENDSILVNLSISDKYFEQVPNDKHLWDNLIEDIKNDSFLSENVNSFYLTYNNELSDAIKSDKNHLVHLYWDLDIVQTLDFGKSKASFKISPFSFFQTNTECAVSLFKTAFDMVWPVNWDILDLYCGAWAVWISYMKYFSLDSKLYWIEIVLDAIENAKDNAKLNWMISNTYFVSGQCHKVYNDDNIKSWINNLWLIILDPPRSWLEKDIINFLWELKKSNPQLKILYISCNPVTMSRDLQLLDDLWYDLLDFKSVDMFPNTHHIESIWLLSAKS